jgi:hypothetical protein
VHVPIHKERDELEGVLRSKYAKWLIESDNIGA